MSGMLFEFWTNCPFHPKKGVGMHLDVMLIISGQNEKKIENEMKRENKLRNSIVFQGKFQVGNLIPKFFVLS